MDPTASREALDAEVSASSLPALAVLRWPKTRGGGMTLTLTITKHPQMQPGVAMSRTLDRGRFVIGRGTIADWTLPDDPDRQLAPQHCCIEFRGDRYYVIALGVNGVFVNDSVQPLKRGNMAELNEGDRLTLGAYEIAVRIESEATCPAERGQQTLDELDPFTDRAPET